MIDDFSIDLPVIEPNENAGEAEEEADEFGQCHGHHEEEDDVKINVDDLNDEEK